MSSSTGELEGRDLDRYAIFVNYLAYENGVYWERASFFMLASSAVFGFVAAAKLPTLGQPTHWRETVVPIGASVFGLLLAGLWLLALRGGQVWIDHWHGLLRDLEPGALGAHRGFRPFETRELHAVRYRNPGLKVIARGVAWLFVALWIIVIVYSVSAAAIYAP